MKAQFAMVDRDYDHNILFIEDIANHTGGTTVTNDAEAVFKYIDHMYSHTAPTPGYWRVVYKDTENEWWEMIPRESRIGNMYITFTKWHGHMWDRLKGNV